MPKQHGNKMLIAKEFQRWLEDHAACSEARDWVGATGYDEITAWRNCERGDWMLWLAARRPWSDKIALVRAACACARTALQYVPAGEDRPRLAIEAAERWCDNPTNDAADASYAAADASYAAADASYAAADASYADAAAYSAARAAARAADSASNAAADAAAYAASNAASNAAAEVCALKQMAGIVREIIKPKTDNFKIIS